MLEKLTSLGVRASRELRMAPLTREPAKPRPGPPNAILIYVSQGRPAPTPKAAQHFSRWLQELMGEARVEESAAEGVEGQSEVELLLALELDGFGDGFGDDHATKAQGDTRKAAKASASKRAKVSGLSNLK
jgi:hypothetical protein